MVEEVDAGGLVAVGVTPSSNAVASSLANKKDMSYYHAHGRPREDISLAKRVTAGDAAEEMVKVDEKDPRFFKRELPPRTIMLKKYLFEDGDSYAKVHVELEDPEILKHGSLHVEFFSTGNGVEMTIEVWQNNSTKLFCAKPVTGTEEGTSRVLYKFLVRDQPFHGPVNPEKSKYRVSSDKKRVVFTLYKLYEEAWHTLNKKEISQHTGWE